MNLTQSQFIGNFQPNFPVLQAGSEEQACIHSVESAVILIVMGRKYFDCACVGLVVWVMSGTESTASDARIQISAGLREKGELLAQMKSISHQERQVQIVHVVHFNLVDTLPCDG